MKLQTSHDKQGNKKPESVQTENFGIVSLAYYNLKLTKTKFGQTRQLDDVMVWFSEPEGMFSKTWFVGKYSMKIADWVVLSKHYTKAGALRAMTRFINLNDD